MKIWEISIPATVLGLCCTVFAFAFSAPAAARETSGTDSVSYETPITYTRAKKNKDVQTLFRYASTVSVDTEDKETDLYVKWRIKTEKSNITLSLVPSLYVIAKGGKDYIEEYYSTVRIHKSSAKEEIPRIRTGTIPHNRKTFPTMAQFFIPDIYSQTLFNGSVLSPFNKSNREYYKYGVASSSDSTVSIAFAPRKRNTQLVSGTALTDKASGRILKAEVSGIYDLLAFRILMEMNDEHQVYPSKCDLRVIFKLAGNIVSSEIISILLSPERFPDDHKGKIKIDSIRPVPLTDEEKAVYAKYDSLQVNKKKKESEAFKKKVSSTAWKIIGDRLFNTFRTELGPNEEFSLKASPLLNPSYLSYSHRKGISYRYDLNGRYVISNNSDFSFKTRLGYMFNQHQFYFDAPFIYTYNRARNGTIRLTVGSGNRITNSSVREQLILEQPDSSIFKKLNLDYYTDMYVKLNTTYDITSHLSANLSVAYHQRSPVSKQDFIQIGQPTVYRTFAPMVELKYRPLKNGGPIFTLDYERGIKGAFKSGLEYEKIETDADWIVKLAPLSSLSLRFGGGLYTNRSKGIYFLDFANFRDNNLPGGWNDDWSGDFQLLNPAWYNISKYYYRSNITFEHPMLLASYLPWVGKFIETERLYVNTLYVDRIHPYMEYGYGFTNSFFSIGVYASTKNWKYESFGFRFTVEMFSNWR